MYNVIIQPKQNNSLGLMWLVKQEDAYTGELVDKQLYEAASYACDFGYEPDEAVLKFINEVVGDENQVDGILSFDIDSAELDWLCITFHSKYAIEYRDMHTAIHHLIVFNSKEDAQNAYFSIKQELLNTTLTDLQLFECVNKFETFDIEFDFRNGLNGYGVEEIKNIVTGDIYTRCEDNEYGILILNHNDCFDVFSS